MKWLDALEEYDRRKNELHRQWLATPEGQEKSAQWADEENRYGDR